MPQFQAVKAFEALLEQKSNQNDQMLIAIAPASGKGSDTLTLTSLNATSPPRSFLGRIMQQIRSIFSPETPAEAGLTSFRKALKEKYGNVGQAYGQALRGRTITLGEARETWRQAESKSNERDPRYSHYITLFSETLKHHGLDPESNRHVLNIFDPLLRNAKNQDAFLAVVGLETDAINSLIECYPHQRQRAQAILKLAAATKNPASALNVIRRFAKPEAVYELGVAGAFVKGVDQTELGLAPGFSGRGRSALGAGLTMDHHICRTKGGKASSQALHQDLLKFAKGHLDPSKQVATMMKNGTPVSLSSDFVRNIDRINLTVNGKTLRGPEKLDSFVAALENEPGGADLALLVSACMNSDTLSTVMDHMKRSFRKEFPPEPRASGDSLESQLPQINVDRSESGWRIQMTYLRTIESTSGFTSGTADPVATVPQRLKTPLTMLSTIDYQAKVQNGKPALTTMETDLVMSGKIDK